MRLSIVKLATRLVALVIGLPLLSLGVIGWSLTRDMESPIYQRGSAALESLLPTLNARMGQVFTVPELVPGLTRPLIRWGFTGMGGIFCVIAIYPRRRRERFDQQGQGGSAQLTGNALRRVEKLGQTLAREGKLVEAGETFLDIGQLDKAADLFIQGEEFHRAGKIRAMQENLIEAAELFERAGRFEDAGTLFSGEEEFVRAAECYTKSGQNILAAEMLEKAGEDFRAGQCYEEVGFFRQAAQAFIRCERWSEAADSLRSVIVEERGASNSSHDRKKSQQLRAMIVQCGTLFEKADRLPEALAVLETGRCFAEAAEVAVQIGDDEKASELFIDAGDPLQAAEALKRLGRHPAAAQILGEYHRDRGEDAEAANYFFEAKDFGSAGDIFRRLEDFRRAGECFESADEFALAAEMYMASGDAPRAAEAFKRANRFDEAADCFAQIGDEVQQAELLEQAGKHLRAGEIFHDQGLDDEAIRVLQQVEADHPEFTRAAALLGGIFRAKGMLSLAIKKLRQAIGDSPMERDNLDAYYTLATVYEVHGDIREAVELYEKIRAIDYSFEDVEQRIENARENLQNSSDTAVTTHAMTAAAALSRPNQGAGRYQILSELGRGGMGIVYKARDTVLDRPVAYKVLPESLKENSLALKNFLREAKSAAQLNHANIVTIYDAGEQDGDYYIAMEYVDGNTLKEVLRRRRILTPSMVVHVLIQMCEALAYAHDKKIVHRDIKTGNTMWTNDRQAKIMDFGLAKMLEGVRNNTTMVAGTPYYMSPEQTLGHDVDNRTDIYSLGVMLFELATGRLPFPDGNVPYHHVHTPPPSPADINAELPEALVNIISRCLQKERKLRYSTARDILGEARTSLSTTG